MKRVLALGLLLLGTSVTFAQYGIGDTPSDFTCTDWDGNSWSLYEQRGKVVLLNFGYYG